MYFAGLGLVASYYPDDVTRGQMMGRVQGAVALGVVLGYPSGALLYHLTDSPAPPFVVLAAGTAVLAGNSYIFLIRKKKKYRYHTIVSMFFLMILNEIYLY